MRCSMCWPKFFESGSSAQFIGGSNPERPLNRSERYARGQAQIAISGR